jgi:hypothetical protein
MDFPAAWAIMLYPSRFCGDEWIERMTKHPTTTGPAPGQSPAIETKQQRFNRILSSAPFLPLKAILDSLQSNGVATSDAVDAANSYPELLSRLGYSVVLAKQIHVQDCYSRLGRAGGIKAVLPHHDMATYSTLVALVNYDLTLTTTAKSVDFFNARLAELKARLKD